MSVLGEGVQSGETGTVHRVATMPDQIPDNPSTIAATTSLETIDQIMYRNWIWRNQFTVDTTMLAGHVFGTIKIHPQSCHDYLTYISKLFLTWTGSMKIRARFQATFQFGGSFRLGWLPPKFTLAQILNMPIQTLTAYPNVDLDPKNTGWMEFQGADERNILFHYMEELTNEDPAASGGTFVFYVAAPLVISGGAGSSVTMLVESAGSFNFAQLAPITSINPTISGILDQDSIFTQVGCDDFARIEAIQIFANTIKSAPLGWFSARATNNRYTRDITRVSMSDPVRTWVTAVNWTPDTSCIGLTMAQPSWETDAGNHYFKPNVLSHQLCANAELSAINLAYATSGTADNVPKYVRSTLSKYILANNITLGFKTDGYNPTEGLYIPIGTMSDLISPYNFGNAQLQISNDATTAPTNDTSTLPVALSENLVGFVSFRHRTMSLQTTQQGIKIAASKMDDNTSQLYELYAADSPTPLLILRLTPYGYFTCNGTATDALLQGKDLYLRYLQDLPMTTPIPSNSYSQNKFLKRALLCTERGLPTEKWDDKLWSRF